MNDICCYILFSKCLGKFYTGTCRDSLEERIQKHNSHLYGNHSFTAAANDWLLYLKIDVNEYSHTIRLERKIKAMKSSKFINNLKLYPELITKITQETS